MRITFIEPGASPNPVGGTRVVYEYANRLAARGHEVTVVHPTAVFPPKNLLHRLRQWSRHRRWARSGRWRPDSWMKVSPAIRMIWVPNLDIRHIPRGDAVIAATWGTAEQVAGYPPDRGRKFYLIQAWEIASGPEERVAGAWRLPLERIVISRGLLDVAERLGVRATYIPNGIDTDRFGIDTPLAQRDAARVAMLYHRSEDKRSADGIAALTLARRQIPDLKAELFGVPPAPDGLPDWIAYRRRVVGPDLRALYNRASVFLSSSRNEAWGLPACEALTCGCALALTDIFGHREFAIDGITALLSPPEDPEALARNLVRLIRDGALRQKLVEAGRERLALFDWERSTTQLEAVLAGRKSGPT